MILAHWMAEKFTEYHRREAAGRKQHTKVLMKFYRKLPTEVSLKPTEKPPPEVSTKVISKGASETHSEGAHEESLENKLGCWCKLAKKPLTRVPLILSGE